MKDHPRATVGRLELHRALDRPDLLGVTVHAALSKLRDRDLVGVAEIDPAVADTAAFCERYGVRAEESANCVVVAARRQGATRRAACVVLASTRADVNGVVRRHLDARKVSFAPTDAAVVETGMEHGGITPIGLPAGWPVLVDGAVARHPRVVVGSGLRRSKLLLPGHLLLALPFAEVIEHLGR
ncbi:MAG: hypothetical protein M0Z46_01160 [Actinomycetota bacterium]|jgi:prolyl-tRNA editing enzyme YbaK/EbsC (Cys-tRNA(Pro) deacylase)|nr:hypothetical protein [Actinomycetota bacterium]